MQYSPQMIYDNLKLLPQVDVATGALFRQQAQEALADPQVALFWKQAIADRLTQVNFSPATVATGSEDSY